MAKLAKSRKINGYVIYQGPSQIDGQPIIAIATGIANKSSNAKTGNLIQTWIMRADISPTEALDKGDDFSICGDCKYRGTVVSVLENEDKSVDIRNIEDKQETAKMKNIGRACYVTVWQAPLVVWKAHTERKIYPTATIDQLGELFKGRTIRLGSYGDPAAVPVNVWRALISQANGHTGYTHQWNMKGADGKRKFLEFRDIVMASADNHQEMVLANALGFRTFRVTGQDSRTDRTKGEVICPASKEKNYATNCQTCKACGGNASKANANIVITVHGAANKIAAHKQAA